MAWMSADDRHEGYVEYVFADGFGGSGWHVDGIGVHTAPDGTWIPFEDRPPSRPASEIAGWRAACHCDGRLGAWHGDLWTRGAATDVKNRVLRVPDVQVDDVEDLPAGKLLRDQWNRHLGPAYTELADVRAAAADVEKARARLDEAVSAARAAGASWEGVGEAAGVAKQSAHQRWGTR